MIAEGKTVSYVGPLYADGPNVGDTGKVLAHAGDHSHVQWATGARTSQVDLVSGDDLVEASGPRARTAAAEISDSLAYGTMLTVAVRETYDEVGETGLLNSLNESGHLGGMGEIAEDALRYVASRVREDPAFSEVLGQLEADEADSLVTLTASVVLRDAFGGEGE